MKKTIAVLAALSLMLLALPASASHRDPDVTVVETYEYQLNPVADNIDDAWGKVRLQSLSNGDIKVKIHATGLAANLPHAQHLHGIPADGGFTIGSCPTIANDGDQGRPVDGLVDTLEGVPAYGGVQQSLTTSGDTSSDSALAVDRFPVGMPGGWLEYNRTFTPTDPAIWEDLGSLEVVVHGVDLNGNGEYDFEFGASSLSEDLPLEATIPALCGGPGN